MSERVANCPNCGAPVKFLWSSAVQTTCAFCHSILVRRDVDLEKVGEVADLPPDSSPIQIAHRRRLRRTSRSWWSAASSTSTSRAAGTSGTSSSTTARAAGSLTRSWSMTFRSSTTAPGTLPQAGALVCGNKFQWNSAEYKVTSLTRAHYKGVEGELPFEYWDKHDVLFADLRTADGRFATIDYSDDKPAAVPRARPSSSTVCS